MTTDRFAAGVLMALGVLTLGTGVYFMAVRPAMLPEDLRPGHLKRNALPISIAPRKRV